MAWKEHNPIPFPLQGWDESYRENKEVFYDDGSKDI